MVMNSGKLKIMSRGRIFLKLMGKKKKSQSFMKILMLQVWQKN
jgi:hypothetical protein